MPKQLGRYFYSPMLNWIYTEGDAPEDAVEITIEEMREYSKSPPTGMYRTAGEDGKPVWKKIPGAGPA